jgi:two-component system, NtrC family, response regulator AtoC
MAVLRLRRSSATLLQLTGCRRPANSGGLERQQMANIPAKIEDRDIGDCLGELGASFLESVSPSMRHVDAIIRELAQSEVPVLLLAEHGAGKQATARRIHDMSRRSDLPFCWFRSSQLTPQALDVEAKNGEAAGGTIYLEEVADLGTNCQLRLRDLLLDAMARNVKESETARFICGSSRDLEVDVKAGRLCEDLYYRISGVCLRLPPLRQRKEDIPPLMTRFLERYAREYKRAVPQLSVETQRLLRDYSWPGNLRELEFAARVFVALGDEHLAMGGLRALLTKPAPGPEANRLSLKAASRAASREAEKELILNVLTRTRWNRRRAAEELQISYKALLYKLKQIGCEGYGA